MFLTAAAGIGTIALPMAELLEMRGVSKVFPGVRALDSVDFTVRRGEIHALMGENGAGKSTLIKVLTGAEPGDGGRILLDGEPIRPRSPKDAQRLGISTVYQEVNLVPNLSVAENLYLGRQPKWLGGPIRWGRMNQLAREALAKLHLRIDVTRDLGSYSIAIQQMVAIARALDVNVKLLILDEPTSSLDAGEARELFAVLRRLREQGLGIVFVTHFLDQVYQVSDRITVLRNGKLVGESETSNLPREQLVAQMMGRELAAFEQGASRRHDETQGADRKVLLSARQLGRRGAIEPFDLDVAAGELVGVAGLLGSGRTEMARLLFGIDRADTGELRVDGQPTTLSSPRGAIRHHFGFLPEDRKTQGIIPDLTLRENIILALQARRGFFRAFSRRRQSEIANHYIKALSIAVRDAEQPVRNLSGGNQQKVILARWLASDPRMLILDEPTRGIDVGAKADIQKLVLALCDEGKAVIFISSELEEVVRCGDRVVVLRDRRKIGELRGGEVNEKRILQTIAGGTA
ncbi:MAG TPA: sugar ABC transporter ATP-binding protein [Tepidisphaeraceae bacterium]|nr:sugar ABC transporter ATP-binding protein [Tepidisphaeraceae bacterium]